MLLCVQTATASSSIVRSVERIVTGPTFVDVFRRPLGLAIIDTSHGILAIGDTGNNRVVLFDSLGRSRGSIHFSTALGAGAGEPKCVAIDRRGRLFVLDAMAATIEVISASGSRLGWLQPQLPETIAEATVHMRTKTGELRTMLISASRISRGRRTCLVIAVGRRRACRAAVRRCGRSRASAG